MIELVGLSKSYGGVQALKGVSFTIPTGAVYGFIGPNGAGKTSTLKILGTLLKPDAGTARIMGVDVLDSPEEVRGKVGWMPDQYGVYPELKVWEFLDFFAAAHGIPKRRRGEVVDSVLEVVGLKAKRDALAGGLSRGMTQKLCLGRALVHEPAVLLLDEPASGLDPQARIELRELLKELQGMGKTILVSSHILPELAEYCTGVAIIQGGEVRFSGTIKDLNERMGAGVRRVRLRLTKDGERALELLRGQAPVKRAEALAPLELELDVAGDEGVLAGLLQALIGQGISVSSFQEAPMDLGDIFLKVTQEAG